MYPSLAYQHALDLCMVTAGAAPAQAVAIIAQQDFYHAAFALRLPHVPISPIGTSAAPRLIWAEPEQPTAAAVLAQLSQPGVLSSCASSPPIGWLVACPNGTPPRRPPPTRRSASLERCGCCVARCGKSRRCLGSTRA